MIVKWNIDPPIRYKEIDFQAIDNHASITINTKHPSKP
jgi:hypothetical protein